jgi:tetratricopeptide (TPR) repeat protein/TolB-like protein
MAVMLALAALLVVAALPLALRKPGLKHLQSVNLRLAILPLETPVDLDAIGNGVLNDVADRLMSRQSNDPTLDVVSAAESLNNNVRSATQAKQTLDATHVLQTRRIQEGTKVIVKAALIDLRANTSLDEISLTYSPETISDWPTALAGMISRTFSLRGLVPTEQLSRSAIEPYLKGMSYLRRDQDRPCTLVAGPVPCFAFAIPFFQQAAKEDTHSPWPRARLVEALVQEYWGTRESRQREKAPPIREEAALILEEAEIRNKDSVPVLLAKGNLEFSNNQFDAALGEYKRVEQLEPRNVQAMLALAVIYQRQGLEREATAYYRKAIEAEPGFYDTYIRFGDFFYLRGRYSQAVSQYSKAAKANPNNSRSYWYLGSALMETAHDSEAMIALSKSLKLEENFAALLTKGAIKAYQKSDAEAMDSYRRALELYDQCYICLLNLADSSRRLGRLREARKFYRQGLQIAVENLNWQGDDDFMRAYVGYFKARLGNHEEGQEYIRQALSQARNNADVSHCAVLTYELLGRRDEALKVAAKTTPELLNQLDRHPDLADFRNDPRFRELKSKAQKGEQ